MSNNCGCPDNSASEGQYIMVKATPSNPSTCAGTSTPAGTAGCEKQEKMYDFSLSDFVVPSSVSGGTSMLVCNASVYSVNMWLQFVDSDVILKISNISGNTLTLVNSCPDGESVDTNPDPGYAVATGAKFVAAGSPPCKTAEEELAELDFALSEATAICTPTLEQSSATAVVHPVGRIESDPFDLSVKKCIKRIYGFVMSAGRPLFSQLGTVIENDDDTIANYRPIVKHKTTHGLHERKNYSETAGLSANKNYGVCISSTNEKILSTYMIHLARVLVEENNASITFSDWPQISIAAPHNSSYDLSVIAPGMFPAAESELDHYYVIARLTYGQTGTGGGQASTATASLNGVEISRQYAKDGAPDVFSYVSVSVPIKVMKSDNLLTLDIVPTDTSYLYFRLEIDGMYY